MHNIYLKTRKNINFGCTEAITPFTGAVFVP